MSESMPRRRAIQLAAWKHQHKCAICGNTPTLYYSNGLKFCKAHKTEAYARAHRGLTTYRSSTYIEQYYNAGGTLYEPPKGHGNTQGYHKFGTGSRKPK